MTDAVCARLASLAAGSLVIAILEAHRAGLLRRSHWLPNLVSGIVVGVVALPLAMAFAIASGARPEQGLYTAIVAGALVSLFGGSRLQIAGPTGAFIVILAGITAEYGIAGLQLATLMAGVILLAIGLAKFGGVIQFIPAPVIVGFTAGIGVIIWVGQWGNFFGLPPTAGEHFHEKLWALLQALPHANLMSTAMALGSLLLVVLAPRLPGLKRIPGPLIAMLVGTVVVAVWHPPRVATIGSAFGGIPQGLPSLSFPDITFAHVIELIGPAFTIAMLGAIESLLSAVVADGMAGTKHDANQELVGQGIANIVAPCFGGFAATGAIARTATNVRSGGTGPLAGIVHTVLLLLVLLVLAPLAANIPLPTLAAILFVVAFNLSEVRHFLRMARRAPRADVVILWITFFLTVFADLVVAVNVGVILAILHFLRRMSSAVDVRVSGDSGTAHADQARDALPSGVQVFAIQGPLFFGAVEKFERALIQIHAYPRVIIIRLSDVPFMDITGLQALESVLAKLRQRGAHVLVCEANPRVMTKLERAEILAGPDDPSYAATFAAALARADALLETPPTATHPGAAPT